MNKFGIHCLIFTFLFSLIMFGQDTICLYEKNIPFYKENKIKEVNEFDNGKVIRISRVNIPEIYIFKSKKANIKNDTSAAVLICPGGGYAHLAIDHEGIAVAKWLSGLGITGIVLKSRLPDENMMTNKTEAPLADARQAIRLIRKNALKWGINPEKIGVMGFSAGGHLGASLSTLYDDDERPDFSILVYPVISMEASLTHMGSRKNLLGENPEKERIIKFSTEKNINTETPPAFLIHTLDDTAVSCKNSIAYYEDLINHGIHDSELHIFPKGGHGYGMAMNNKSTLSQWTELLKNWLFANNWIRD